MNFGQPIPFWQNLFASNDVIFFSTSLPFPHHCLVHTLDLVRTNKYTPCEESVLGILFTLTSFSSYSSSTLEFLLQQKIHWTFLPINFTPSTLGVTPAFLPNRWPLCHLLVSPGLHSGLHWLFLYQEQCHTSSWKDSLVPAHISVSRLSIQAEHGGMCLWSYISVGWSRRIRGMKPVGIHSKFKAILSNMLGPCLKKQISKNDLYEPTLYNLPFLSLFK